MNSEFAATACARCASVPLLDERRQGTWPSPTRSTAFVKQCDAAWRHGTAFRLPIEAESSCRPNAAAGKQWHDRCRAAEGLGRAGEFMS